MKLKYARRLSRNAEKVPRRPDDRPQTAGELERELAAIPVAPWTEEQARAWWTVNRPGELTPIATPEMETREAGEQVTRPGHVLTRVD